MGAKHFSIFAGIISVCAGIHLASLQSVASNSLISSIANGIGWYFMAKGIYMISSLYQTNVKVED